MSKITFKFSTVVAANFNFTYFKCLKLHLNSPPWWLEEHFDFYRSQMSKIALKFSTVVGGNFNFTDLKCLKLHLNSSPGLEKILNFN